MARFSQSLTLAMTTTRIGRGSLHAGCLVRELTTRRPVRWRFHLQGIRREFSRASSATGER